MANTVSRDEYIKARNERLDTIYKMVKKALDKADCEQLLSMGCPKDEYDGESKRISQDLERQTGIYGVIPLNKEAIQNTVAYFMWGSFHGANKPVKYDIDCYKEAAELIWEDFEPWQQEYRKKFKQPISVVGVQGKLV